MGRGRGAPRRADCRASCFRPRSYAPTPFCRSWDHRYACCLRGRRRKLVTRRERVDPFGEHGTPRDGAGLVLDHDSGRARVEQCESTRAAHRPQRNGIDQVHSVENEQCGRHDAASVAGLSSAGVVAGMHQRHRRDLLRHPTAGSRRNEHLPGRGLRDPGRLRDAHRKRRRAADRRGECNQLGVADAGRPDRQGLRRHR